MVDDGFSASELRQRYGRGGSVRDCDMSAAQLRSRYAIPGNKAASFRNSIAFYQNFDPASSRSVPLPDMLQGMQEKWPWLAVTATATAISFAALYSQQQPTKERQTHRRLSSVSSTDDTDEDDPLEVQAAKDLHRHSQSFIRSTPTQQNNNNDLTRSKRGGKQKVQSLSGSHPPIGLQIGHGYKDRLLTTPTAEVIALVSGILSLYVAAQSHYVLSIFILLATFLFRLKSTEFNAAYAPLTPNTKHQLLNGLERHTLRGLLQNDMPDWIKYPDVEKCEWFNQGVATLWPYMKVALAKDLRDSFAPSLEGIKQKLKFTDVSFSAVDLGTAAPVVNGVKTHRTLDEQIVLDLDLLFLTQNSEVVLTVGNPESNFNLQVELTDFLLRGTLRMEFKPLFPRWPTFGALTLCFTEKPTVNFQLNTMHMNLMEMPALSSALRKQVREALDSTWTWPNRKVIPMVDDLSQLEMDLLSANKPLGMLMIKNLTLRGVSPTSYVSSMSGQFAYKLQMAVGKEEVSTDTVYGRSSCDFGPLHFNLLVLDPQTQDLHLTLKFSESLWRLSLADSKYVHLDHLNPHEPSKEVITLSKKGNAQVEFELVWYPFKHLSATQCSTASTNAMLPATVSNMGAVFVSLRACETLTPMDYSGSSDPYVVLKVGAIEKRSTTKLKTLDPVWDPAEKFYMLVSNNRHDYLEAIVMDSDYLSTDDEIGRVKISLADVQSTGQVKQEKYLLDNGGGFIVLDLEWHAF